MLQDDVRQASKDCPILSPERVRQLEQSWSATTGQPTYVLMERAGSIAWAFARRRFPRAERWLVVAGPGNNGGDAYEVAYHALKAGKHVVLALERPEKGAWQATAKGDAALALAKLLPLNPQVVSWREMAGVQADLVIDGLLGSGARAPARDQSLLAIRAMNDLSAPVFSLDVPSGLDAMTGQPIGDAVRAEATLSFVALKPGQVTGDGLELCGQLAFDDLQVPVEATQAEACLASWQQHRTDRPGRRLNSHKGNHGHVLLVGGDLGMGGAALLAAEAAMRTGVGRLTVVTRGEHRISLLTRLPEAMVLNADQLSEADFQARAQQAQVVLAGPGLGRGSWGEWWFERVQEVGLPTVLDADALYWLAQKPAAKRPTIVTPHPGEAAMLLRLTAREVQSDRWQALSRLRTMAETVILKGAGTLVGGDSGNHVCALGNPGMASAGMGDVLAGVVASLLAQGMTADQAALYGVLLHAQAGDEAARDGMVGTLATDLLPWLRRLQNRRTSS